MASSHSSSHDDGGESQRAPRPPAMRGLMQDWPLNTNSILKHAALFGGERAVVTNTVEGGIHSYTYRDMAKRCAALAHMLQSKLGVHPGDIVGTIAWNTYRHMEIWYAVMGIEAVCHTLNPRLFPEQLTYIANHAGDSHIFADIDLLGLVKELAPTFKTVKSIVFMTDAIHMPSPRDVSTSFPSYQGIICYEDFIASNSVPRLVYSSHDDHFTWPHVHEEAACGLCYTSGTTGNPKGVLYSHRSNVLHGMMCIAPGCFNMGPMDVMLPVVPMFHANAWAIAFGAPIACCKLALPGPKLDGATLHGFFEGEGVTVTAAVPTVWLGLLQYMEESGKRLTTLKRVVIGGAACPQSVLEAFESKYNVEVRHAWGMTELSPIGTVFAMTPTEAGLSKSEQLPFKLMQGRPIYTVEMKVVDDDGEELPRDGVTPGHLMVRGPSIVKAYMKGEGGAILDEEGWFDTGDVAALTPSGIMRITDRSKDVIKSGGEWISSIEIENAAVDHPAVQEAAVIGMPHPKWSERPVLVLVKKPGAQRQDVNKEIILKFLVGKIAKWWMPDDVLFVNSIPHTATGKIDKKRIRQQLKDGVLISSKL